jgi:hypothetical protein
MQNQFILSRELGYTLFSAALIKPMKFTPGKNFEQIAPQHHVRARLKSTCATS